MKLHLKLISLLLALLLLTSAWGCSLPGIGDESGEATSEKATTTLPPEDIVIEETAWDEVIEYETETEILGPFTEPVPVTTPDPGFIDCPFYPTADFGGETVKILYGSDAERNEFDQDLTGEIVNDGIYARNIKVEKLLNVKFEWKGMNALSSHANEYVQYAEAMSAAGEGFDIYAATRRAMSQLLTSGMLQDFNKITDGYIDLSQVWYPTDTQRLDLTVGGANFLATGNISANSLLQMNAIFYNVRLLGKLGKTDPVSLVREGKWTLDALIELSRDVYVDQDNSGSKTAADDYGFVQVSYLDSDAFYSGSGVRFFDIDPTGDRYVKASDEINSAKSGELNTKLFDFFSEPSSYVGSTYTVDTDYSIPFAEDRALFCHGTLSMADNGIFTEDHNGQFRTIFDFEHGILPIPKYDEKQEQYVTTLSNKAVFWGINNYLYPERSLMSSAVIEMMAYEGYTMVAPLLFENVMKIRYYISEASAKSEMFDLIRESVRIDPGKLFSEKAYALPSKFANGVTSSANHWILTVTNSQTRALIQRNETELNRLIEYALTNQNQ